MMSLRLTSLAVIYVTIPATCSSSSSFSILVNDNIIQLISQTRNFRINLNSSPVFKALPLCNLSAVLPILRNILNQALLPSTLTSSRSPRLQHPFSLDDCSHFFLGRTLIIWTSASLGGHLFCPQIPQASHFSCWRLPKSSMSVHDCQPYTCCCACLKCSSSIITLGKLLIISQSPKYLPLLW